MFQLLDNPSRKIALCQFTLESCKFLQQKFLRQGTIYLLSPPIVQNIFRTTKPAYSLRRDYFWKPQNTNPTIWYWIFNITRTKIWKQEYFFWPNTGLFFCEFSKKVRNNSFVEHLKTVVPILKNSFPYLYSFGTHSVVGVLKMVAVRNNNSFDRQLPGK